MTHPPCVGCDDPLSAGQLASGPVFLLRNMTQRSRRAGTAPIKRPAEPAGIAFWNMEHERI